MSDIIKNIFDQNKEIMQFLEEKGQVSFKSDADIKFKKELLLCAASYFENRITEMIIKFIEKETNGNNLVGSFVRSKAIDRQYHTFFKWDYGSYKNANQFFSFFGSDFKIKMNEEIRRDKQLEESILAFLEIGTLRNRLVHQNFATFYLDKTSEEIYSLYEKAIYFITFLESKFCSV